MKYLEIFIHSFIREKEFQNFKVIPHFCLSIIIRRGTVKTRRLESERLEKIRKMCTSLKRGLNERPSNADIS